MPPATAGTSPWRRASNVQTGPESKRFRLDTKTQLSGFPPSLPPPPATGRARGSGPAARPKAGSSSSSAARPVSPTPSEAASFIAAWEEYEADIEETMGVDFVVPEDEDSDEGEGGPPRIRQKGD